LQPEKIGQTRRIQNNNGMGSGYFGGPHPTSMKFTNWGTEITTRQIGELRLLVED